jgi:apolipoprotein N-acyltransferase
MQELAKHKWLLSFLSGVLTFIAVCHINFMIAWFCLVPLFMVLNMQSSKNSLRLGLVFGLAISVFGFYWMIPGAERFTGASIFYGILAFIYRLLFLLHGAGLLFSVSRP